MPSKLRKSKPLLRIALSIVLIIATILTILLVLERSGVTNLYTQESIIPTQQFPTDSEGNRLPNTVDYGAPKPEDTTPIPDKNTNATPSPILPINPELSISMTSTRKSGDLYLIKAIISGTDNATCRAIMSKGSLSATTSSGAAMIEGQYSCKDLSIPMSQLTETGEWDLELTVTDKNGASASSTEKVIL